MNRNSLSILLPLSALILLTTANLRGQAPEVKPVPIQSAVLVSPTNSHISFVGIHVGDDPKPRLGGFAEFNGYAIVDSTSKSVESITLDINVDSVWTQFEKLTTHLKNADFFETDKFPSARFVTTEIKSAADGKCTITGNLTLHGQTKSITFPGKFQLDNGGLLLAAKFKLDRSQFGMDQMLSGVDKMVEVELFIGQATQASKAQPGHGGDSKKKQSKKEDRQELRQVALKLPHMT